MDWKEINLSESFSRLYSHLQFGVLMEKRMFLRFIRLYNS